MYLWWVSKMMFRPISLKKLVFAFFPEFSKHPQTLTIRPPKSKILLRLPGYVLSSVWKIETISSTASAPNWWIFGFGDFYYMVYRVKLRSSAGGLEHALIMAIFGFSESIWSQEWVKLGSHRNFWLFVKHYISWATLPDVLSLGVCPCVSKCGLLHSGQGHPIWPL